MNFFIIRLIDIVNVMREERIKNQESCLMNVRF